MVDFKHVSDRDWGWISTMAHNVYGNKCGFVAIQLTGEQFCLLFEELNRIKNGDLIDQEDVEQICARIASTVEAKKKKETVQEGQ